MQKAIIIAILVILTVFLQSMSVWTFVLPILLALVGYCLILLPEQYFYVGFESTPQPMGQAGPVPNPNKEKDGIYRETVKFDSDGTTCEAWLYIPVKGTIRHKHNLFTQ